jgi:hypothetical protein
MRINGKTPFVTGAGCGTGATRVLIAIMFGLLTQAGCASSPQSSRDQSDHRAQHQQHTMSDSTRSALATPAAIKIEHEHLHHQLDAAVAAGGTTGARAREVAAILLPHFEEEEAYAMPPLGLLVSLARNESLDDATVGQAIEMAQRLRQEYANMLHEHKLLTEALRRLASAAREEGKPDHAAFADALIVHAQNEEQVLYPATLVIGEYLKLKRQRASEAAERGR